MEKEEQILVGIAGQDRPGVTASVTEILAKYNISSRQYLDLIKKCQIQSKKMENNENEFVLVTGCMFAGKSKFRSRFFVQSIWKGAH